MVNERKSYALVNEDTGKVIKHDGKFHYYRLRQLAIIEMEKLKTLLGIKIRIKKLKPTTLAGGKRKEKENREVLE